MKKKLYPICFLGLLSYTSIAQSVAINTDGGTAHPSAIVDIKSTTGGLLIPRMTQTQRIALNGGDVATGLLVYQIDEVTGFYYYNGSAWSLIGSTNNSGTGSPSSTVVWRLDGNRDTEEDEHFMGTKDDKTLTFRVNNIQAGFIDKASGNKNTAFGYNSLPTTLLSTVSIGAENSAFGHQALRNNTMGNRNTAIGTLALTANLVGSHNTAIGFQTMQSNTVGVQNIATGALALANNTTGNQNTAIGYQAMNTNVAGNNGVAIGYQAMYLVNNSTLSFLNTNTAIGYQALRGGNIAANNTGLRNTAIGNQTLFNNTEGSNNVANGTQALFRNAEGSNNIAIGNATLFANLSGNNNVAVGNSTLSQGNAHNSVTAVGHNINLSTTRNNVVAIGANINDAQCTGDNQIVLGNTAITSIRSQVGSITTYSDGRYKTDVRRDVKGLDFITRLTPVTYTPQPAELHKIWGVDEKVGFTAPPPRQIGFIAQEVEQAAIEAGFEFLGLEVPKQPNQVYALRYGDFIMPLVQAVKELKAENDALKMQNDRLANQIAELEGLKAKIAAIEKLMEKHTNKDN